MIYTTHSEVKKLFSTPLSSAPLFKRVLMVTPEHFDVRYAINPYMKDADGNLKKVDRKLAVKQWETLKSTYERLGLPVATISATPELPDMVFAANQSLPMWDRGLGKPKVVLGRMASPNRSPEEQYFRDWYEGEGYVIEELRGPGLKFEGNGDALFHPGSEVLWAAVGSRSDAAAYDEISSRTGIDIIRFSLRASEFYHLDTCFSILSPKVLAIQKLAFDAETVRIFQEGFERVIEIDFEECYQSFAGNCHSPDGKHVLLHPGAKQFMRELVREGFTPIEIDTSEFLKSGGSVFCLKCMVY